MGEVVAEPFSFGGHEGTFGKVKADVGCVETSKNFIDGVEVFGRRALRADEDVIYECVCVGQSSKCTIDCLLELSRHVSKSIEARGKLIGASGKSTDNAKIALVSGGGAKEELTICIPKIEAREPYST